MSLLKSKQRVADHREVFAPAWVVAAMLNLVQGETERIDSRFLEPACGSGNFLVQILLRKFAAVEVKFGRSEFGKRQYASASSAEDSLFAQLRRHEIFTPTKTCPPMSLGELAAATWESTL